jgi:tetratricopeptide (TPR) repeat protein
MIIQVLKNPLRFSLYAAAVPAIILCAAFFDPYADRVNEGNSSYNDGKFSEAEKYYNEAEQYLPSKRDAAELAFNKGNARFGAGDYDGAIEFYKAALASEKKNVQKKALFNMGNAFAKKGDKASAADAYLSALRIDPSYMNAKKNLEALYRKDKKDDKNDKQKDKDQNKDKNKNQDQKQDQNQGKDKQDQAAKGMNKDQIKSLLQMMKDKPVRRQKNDEEKGLLGGGHEKPW